MTNPHSWYFLLWLAIEDGGRYHFTINPCMRGNATVAGINAMDDLSTLITTAGSPVGPGTGNSRSLDIISHHANLSSPVGSDNFTNLHLAAKWKDVQTDLRLSPTGKNLYIGGNGGFTLPNYGGEDYQTLIPGYTWYWVSWGFFSSSCEKKHPNFFLTFLLGKSYHDSQWILHSGR